ncbi:MAG: hypothetical protein CVV44_02860 [Spirochaetae bacterium HGW-Spirochaetae-1]|jgi:uncharacterized protein YebE (UPF0316 family)|nr:MAG: hypothetical protein CVV44_02860 [Spirochaetae bacterium HGW-Spirochaetae-1]
MTQDQILTLAFIFFARICDVSIGTIRIVMISRGYRTVAPIFGFFEVLIWLMAISRALASLDNIYSYFIYAAGFAAGNYMGMWLEEMMPFGYKSLRVITSKEVSVLPLTLRSEGFGVTVVDGTGLRGPVSILYSLVPKKSVKKYIDIVTILEPRAFVTIEEVRVSGEGFFARKPFHNFHGRLLTKKK